MSHPDFGLLPEGSSESPRNPVPQPSSEDKTTSTSPDQAATLQELLPYFLAYCEYEWHFSKETIRNYRVVFMGIIRVVGDIHPETLRMEHVLEIKTKAAQRGVGLGRIRSIISTLKTFLRFCELGLGLQIIDRSKIKPPRVPKRDVVFLTREEVQRFVAAIPLYNKNHVLSLRWLTFRALVEVLLGTGARISEALSLRMSMINFETGEAIIIGKGNKQRTVFFSPRALGWVKELATRRHDGRDEVFVGVQKRPLRTYMVQAWFQEIWSRSGLKKKVTAHILRHTVATTLLFNGCPIGHIKEILGHELLETTCRFYLGVDKTAAKQAHQKFLDYDQTNSASGTDQTHGIVGSSLGENSVRPLSQATNLLSSDNSKVARD